MLSVVVFCTGWLSWKRNKINHHQHGCIHRRTTHKASQLHPSTRTLQIVLDSFKPESKSITSTLNNTVNAHLKVTMQATTLSMELVYATRSPTYFSLYRSGYFWRLQRERKIVGKSAQELTKHEQKITVVTATHQLAQ